MSPSDVTWTVFFKVTIDTSSPSFGPNSGASDSGVSESRSPPTIKTGTSTLTVGTAGGRFERGQSRQMSYGCEKPLIVSHSAAVNGANASGAPAKDFSRG